MHRLEFADSASGLTVLCLGAHSDDLEIGCGGTLLRWRDEMPNLRVHWVVLSRSNSAEREAEARASAASLLGDSLVRVDVADFRDGFFPAAATDIKEYFERAKREVEPDLILTHRRCDLHQDHRLVGELTWNTFRNHLIMEYEIPKYDGDLGRPNVFVQLTAKHVERKIDLLMTHFPSQRNRHWFAAETFSGLMRLRGLESNAESGYAEGFHGHKLVF